MPDMRYTTIAAVVLVFVAAAVVVRFATRSSTALLGALDIVGAENRDAVHARAQAADSRADACSPTAARRWRASRWR